MDSKSTDSIELDDCDHFTNLLNLKDILQGVIINKLTTTNAYCSNTKKQFSKLNITCTIGLNFKVDIDTFFPRQGSISHEFSDIYQMKIYVHDTDIRNEIRSFTNYLQRQKNINLTVIVLKKLAIAVGHRKLIIDLLYLNTEGNITTKNQADNGISFVCNVHDIKYFKSNWKLHLNYSTHEVLDIIDFTVTKKDNSFYNSVRNSMNLLIQQNLPYNRKVDLWMVIVDAVNVKMNEPVIEIIENDKWDQKDYVLMSNSAEVDNGILEQFEILESDHEDCHIIES